MLGVHTAETVFEVTEGGSAYDEGGKVGEDAAAPAEFRCWAAPR